MGLRHGAAKAISGVTTWGLRNIARRSAANMPGKIALYADPRLIADERHKLTFGSVCVVGTNGKTTVNNLLADCLEQSGHTVVCNRTGANLDSGVATALLQHGRADWGVFECDELWLRKILPALQANYVVLLNLFRDQLDRCGEIDRIQDSIVNALVSSPQTTLVFNADDPLCAMVAERAAAAPEREGVANVAFGTSAPLGLEQNVVSDTTMCQRCSHMLHYDFRQYGQLGKYECPNCGFARPDLSFEARDVQFDSRGLSFEVCEYSPKECAKLQARLSGSYMVYNLLAVYVAARLMGCDAASVQKAIDAFNPHNGRLQEFKIGEHRVLLNLAKNPTGFNQNLRIVAQQAVGKCAVAFFINDKEADGHDISWIWDVDFEELSGRPEMMVFAGGTRRNDLQVRLKHAGIKADLIEDAEDMFKKAAAAGLPNDADEFFVVNYTALAPVHRDLDRLAADPCALDAETSPVSNTKAIEKGEPASNGCQGEPIVIAHLFPDLLNLYGDGGNVRILKNRLQWRGIPAEVREVHYGEGESFDFADVDLVFLGGAPDREQKLASEQLHEMRDSMAAYVEDGGPLLAICGGYQMLGRTWLLGDEEVPGLGIVGIETRRPGTSADRLIENIALKSPLAEMPVIGYENHAGRTYLDEGVEAFGHVVSHVGKGNNDKDHADGVVYKNVIGTYLHGPLLSKNPEVADWLLEKALVRNAERTGQPKAELTSLPDEEEKAANAFMSKKFLR